MYHLGVENRRLTLCTHRPRDVLKTVVGVAKSPEGNAWSRDAVSREQVDVTNATPSQAQVHGSQSVKVKGWVSLAAIRVTVLGFL